MSDAIDAEPVDPPDDVVALANTSSPDGGRRLRFLFFSLASAGIVVSFALGMREVHDRPELTVSDARIREEGLVSTVQVTVTNDSTGAWCPTIAIAARNRDGRDIEKLIAAPVEGTGRITPGQTVGFRAVFADMTARDYERLDKFVGFVDAQQPC